MKKQKKTKEVIVKVKKPKIKNLVRKIVKRSGNVVPFDQKKIFLAIGKALDATGEGNKADAKKVGNKVIQILNKNYKKGTIPTVEELQDLIERVLMILDFEETAKAYI